MEFNADSKKVMHKSMERIFEESKRHSKPRISGFLVKVIKLNNFSQEYFLCYSNKEKQAIII